MHLFHRVFPLTIFFFLGIAVSIGARSVVPEALSSRVLPNLANSAETIDISVERSGLRPESSLAIYGDVHGVYAVPRAQFLAVLNDIDRYHEFVPNMAESELIRQISATEAIHRTLLRFRLLIFRADFETLSRVTVEELSPRASAVRFVFEESLDGRVSHMEGSWYLETVFIGGREHTYVRYRIWTEYANPVVGQAQATQRFGSRQLRELLDAYGQRVEEGL
ncbi:MAG: hypothetical protein EA383_07930 [Spirochaetaceae bacterium]|nr:MAG: hypothetical protein EA383_07930 [Spirochaetaceae bacterium]